MNIELDSKYVPFFNIVPMTAQLTLRMLVPNKYPELTTEIFSCVCIQQGILRNEVISNLKECADKIVNNITKQDTSQKKDIVDFNDMPISDEFAVFLDNYFYFTNMYKGKLDSSIVTAYITYILITNKELKSYVFFQNCLYAKKKDSVLVSLLTLINGCIGSKIAPELNDYGYYLMDGLTITNYDCFGRENEIEECVQTLCRMKKSNVILVGNPGVGKTNIVYGVCNYLQSENCPELLKGKCIFSLEVNRLISGTTFRGDLEKRLDNVIDLLETHKDIILFIDELHTLFNKPTGEESSASLQSVFKPYLERNSIVIGCTTENEYRIIESDKAFERRFQKIQIKEPSLDITKKIVKNSKINYVAYHSINISDDICNYIVDQCDIKIRNRYFPDKALDILDRSCVYSKQQKQEITKQIVDTCIDISNGIYRKTNSFDMNCITQEIKSVLFGQDEAVDSVCKVIKKHSLGIQDKNKPIGSFLFVGPTGTGKTELCKQIARLCFTDESFIRLDMSEFMEQHSVSKIIGSPPGYVGYSNGGVLCEKVKNNQNSIILIDEVEKAHKDVMNVFLQVMDDGRLTDSSGMVIDFRNCIIVMTSNLGCKDFLNKKSIGFGDNTQKQDVIEKSIKDHFSPEFLNRLDKIVYFNKITKDVCLNIVEDTVNRRLEVYKDKLGQQIYISDKAKELLSDTFYSESDGARFVKKGVTNTLDDLVLEKEFKEDRAYKFVTDNNKIILEEYRL